MKVIRENPFEKGFELHTTSHVNWASTRFGSSIEDSVKLATHVDCQRLLFKFIKD